MQSSTVGKRKRQALLALPVVVIPFLTMAFWAMGGGKGEARQQDSSSGLNLQLPNAQLKSDDAQNKMSFYDQAEKDSASMRAAQRNDGQYPMKRPQGDTAARNQKSPDASYDPYPAANGSYTDPNEEAVYQKLAQLNEQLHRSQVTGNQKGPDRDNKVPALKSSSSPEGEARMKTALQQADSGSGEDTEMNNINALMEKVLDIQHPERVSGRIKEGPPSGNRPSFPMRSLTSEASVSLLGTAPKKEPAGNGFYSLPASTRPDTPQSIAAVVHESQTLVDGAVIKLRLLQAVNINGTGVPKDVFVFGIATLSGERLEVAVSSIRYKNLLLPVKLTVYDMDGLPGIYVPGAITRDVAKSSVDNAAQLLEVASLDPTLKGQATSAGLGAVRSLLSRKTKLVKVVVKGGYQVLLTDTSAASNSSSIKM